MPRIAVTVTEDHIRRAGKDSHRCPLALALRDMTGDLWSVGSLDAFNMRTGETYALAADAKRVVSDFDNGWAVKPCVCHLDKVVPVEVVGTTATSNVTVTE